MSDNADPESNAAAVPTKLTFLTLPAELRIKIYRDLLYPDQRSGSVIREATRRREERRRRQAIAKIKPKRASLPRAAKSKGVSKEDLEAEKQRYRHAVYHYYQNKAHLRALRMGWRINRYCYDIDPTVLRVNKQIYAEAVSFLYEYVGSEINLCDYQYFRELGGWVSQSWSRYNVDRDSYGGYVIKDRQRKYEISDKTAQLKELLNLPCLWRMRQVEIKMFWRDFLDLLRGPGHRTPEGSVMLQVLRGMSEVPKQNGRFQKQLHLTLPCFWSDEWLHIPRYFTARNGLLVLNGDIDSLHGLEEVIGLLKSIKQNRQLSIRIEFWLNDHQMKAKEIDLGNYQSMIPSSEHGIDSMQAPYDGIHN